MTALAGDLFDAAPKLAIRRSAKIAGGCRWTLTRIWSDAPILIVVMCNPSVANGERDDPTMLRVIHFAQAWGYGGVIVVNMYPWITPDPKQCREWSRQATGEKGYVFDPYRRDELQTNLAHIIAECQQAKAVLLAFGNPWDWSWAQNVIDEIESATDATLICLSKTKEGAPTHPLARGRNRIPNDAQPQAWRVAA